MKNLSQLLFGLLTAVMCTGICSGQTLPPEGSAATPTNGAKSIVQGKVVQESSGEGIRKVRVSLRGGSDRRRAPYEAISDGAGLFKVEDVEPGTYVVTLERPGYAESEKTNSGKTIQVIAGQDTKDLVFQMLVAGVISGKIVDLDGDPLRNVDVMAMPRDGIRSRKFSHMGRAATNDLGEYRIADLPPGKYLVSAKPPEGQTPAPGPSEKGTPPERLAYVTTYFPGTSDERQAAVVEVLAGATATADFAAQTGHVYRVSGTVTGLSSQPMAQNGANETALEAMMRRAGAGQLLLAGKTGQIKEQNLGEDGKFEFTDVLPGTYKAQVISFSGLFSSRSTLESLPRPSVKTIRTPIEVSDADVVGLQLQVDAGGDVSGRFRIEGDERIDWKELNVGLSKVPSSEEEPEIRMGIPSQAFLKADGSFDMKDVPAADYQLVVYAHSGKFRDYYTKSVLLGGREVADTGFAVGPGTVLDVVISAKGAGIEGTVLDKEDKPVSEATVVTAPSSGKLGRPDAYQFGRTDQNGHFWLRGLNPGEFLVLAFDEMQENYRTPEFAKKYEGKGEKVELEEGGKKSVVLKLITGSE